VYTLYTRYTVVLELLIVSAVRMYTLVYTLLRIILFYVQFF